MEGIEGSGKTTQGRALKAALEKKGHSCILTREPGGTFLGEKIRAILLDPAHTELAPAAERLLYTADRLQHVQAVINPALAAGHIVICDRYFDATLAYQGYGRGLDIALIRNLHQLLLNGLTPDLTLLLDLTPQTGLARAWQAIDSGGRAPDETRFENEAIAFHDRVRQGYLTLAHAAPERFCIIDGAQEADRVTAALLEAVFQKLR